MPREPLARPARLPCLFLGLALSACSGSSSQGPADAQVAPDMAAVPFSPDPPAVYVAKVKNLLVGLPPTDAEVKAVVADPTALKGLIDGWMALPEYQQKMLTFFQLAFQQTQITTADFVDLIPKNGIGIGPAVPLLVQNIRESFARTVLELIAEGQPLTAAVTTHRVMMTPAMMELYAFLDTWHVDDTGRITDELAAANKGLTITVEAAKGPIAIADTVDPTSPSYMHWYFADLAKLTWPYPSCATDPISLPISAYALHYLLYGATYDFKGPDGNCPPRPGTMASAQMGAADFTAWKMVTIRPPNAGEATTRFFDLPTLRTASELVIRTPHPGFFTTPAFFANWQTNQSNQMRVTLNQALIVATGMQVDGTDQTPTPTTPGLDTAHAPSGSACYSCHRTLDPTRSILSSTYSWFYYTQTDPTLMAEKGLFTFQGVSAPVSTIDEFASTLAAHPAFAKAWAQKLCYYANSAPCLESDPEFQRIVSAFQAANYGFATLVRELFASPIVTNATESQTAAQQGEVVAVSRRDHLCAALDDRLGLVDVCGLDVATAKTRASALVPQIAAGLPSDGYGRGSTIPVLPNQPTLFYRAGVENICEAVAGLVIDAAPTPGMPNRKQWSSAQPQAAIADFVATIMALTPSDARAAPAQALLEAHFAQAMKSGASASDALKSTFVLACLSPSFVGIGL